MKNVEVRTQPDGAKRRRVLVAALVSVSIHVLLFVPIFGGAAIDESSLAVVEHDLSNLDVDPINSPVAEPLKEVERQDSTDEAPDSVEVDESEPESLDTAVDVTPEAQSASPENAPMEPELAEAVMLESEVEAAVDEVSIPASPLPTEPRAHLPADVAPSTQVAEMVTEGEAASESGGGEMLDPTEDPGIEEASSVRVERERAPLIRFDVSDPFVTLRAATKVPGLSIALSTPDDVYSLELDPSRGFQVTGAKRLVGGSVRLRKLPSIYRGRRLLYADIVTEALERFVDADSGSLAILVDDRTHAELETLLEAYCVANGIPLERLTVAEAVFVEVDTKREVAFAIRSHRLRSQ